ncbi:MAG: hypothetical protein IJQ80_03690, partial [Clostridia bacterium]|nr:hypothetical protein [Clostridia bacterium]
EVIPKTGSDVEEPAEEPETETEPTDEAIPDTADDNNAVTETAKSTGDNLVTFIFIAMIAVISGAAFIIGKKIIFTA